MQMVAETIGLTAIPCCWPAAAFTADRCSAQAIERARFPRATRCRLPILPPRFFGVLVSIRLRRFMTSRVDPGAWPTASRYGRCLADWILGRERTARGPGE